MGENKYFPQYDTLRFLSIIAIILYHYMTHRVTGGFLAVNFFFILSGFLTTRQLEKQYRAGTFPPLGKVISRRWQAIFWPMLFVVLCGVTFMVIFRQNLLVNIAPTIFSSLFFVNNWQQILAGSSYFAEMLHPSLFTHLWYLSVYFQFIVIWQILFRTMRRYFKSSSQSGLAMGVLALLSAILMAVIFIPGEDPSRVYYGTDTRIFSFAIGGMAGQLIEAGNIKKRSGKFSDLAISGLSLIVFGVILWLIFNLQDAATSTYYGGMLIFDISVAAMIVLLSIDGTLIGKLFSFKPTAWLGRRSYPMYLWYYPIFVLFHVSGGQMGFAGMDLTAQIVLILLLGLLTYQLTVKRKWLVPIFLRPQGEPLRLLTGLRQVRHPQTPLYSKVLFGFFSLITIGGLVGPFLSTSAENQTVQEQEALEQQAQLESINAERANQEQAAKANLEAYRASLNTEQETYYSLVSEADARFAYNLQPTFIGDSLMLGASEALYTLYPKAIVNAEVGRQVYKMQPIIAEMVGSGQILNPVIISLGANGGFSEQNIKDMITAIGEDKIIFFVNTHVDRPWRDEVNSVLAQVTENPDDDVYLIDWASHYQDQGAILRDDLVHFNEQGILAWTSFITQEVNKNMSN